jgi:hypothetical protein
MAFLRICNPVTSHDTIRDDSVEYSIDRDTKGIMSTKVSSRTEDISTLFSDIAILVFWGVGILKKKKKETEDNKKYESPK